MLPSSIDLRPKHDDTSPRASHHSPSSSSSSSIFRATTIDCEQELLANNEQLNRNESHSEDAANITINEMKDNGCNDLRVFDGYFLYSVIRESKVSIADIVDEWLKSYVDDIKLSLLSLLQLIISSSNSRLVITKALYDNLTLNEIYKEITNNFVEDDIYPLIDQSIASFGSTLYEFIYKLSKSASFTFLLDDLIIPELFAFLKLCCNSNYRSLRHTATFIGLIFGNGLLHSMWNLAKNVSKQLDASIVSENNKISASLMSETDQNEQKKLKSYFSFVMNDIFCMRYRDVCHEIRTLCITMLGQWMKIYPQEIILDKNLKYIGWLLYDKQFNVRIQCLSVLIDQSVSLQSLNMIENFLKRFKDRLLQMTYDINNDVSLQAIKLFDKICKLKTYKTSEEDFKIICRNLRVNNRKIASGSAKLLLSINGFHNTKNLNRDSNFAIFNILASAIIDYQDFQSTLLFVDAFTEHISHILNSWDVYSDYLNDLSGN
ncbi:MAG: Cohesin subunit SA-2 [Marteilia pararefringens]